MKPFKIGRGEFRIGSEHPLIAAPMAGAIEPPYREILHRNGIEISFTEMVSARGTYEGSSRTMELAGWIPEEGHSGAQIFGPDPKYLRFASRKMVELGHHIIDINAGCPKRKVLAHKAGGYFLKDPKMFISCVSSVVDEVDIPVGVKTRSGFNDYDERSFLHLLKDLEDTGISFITIHPRTVKQGFSGDADRDVIEKAASELNIPVIASGDVRGWNDVADYLTRGAGAVMIGRALLGDPFLPNRILAGDNKDFPKGPGDVDALMDAARDHLNSTIRFYGEKRGCIKFRTHISWYMKRMKGRKHLAIRVHALSTEGEVISLMEDIREDWKSQWF